MKNTKVICVYAGSNPGLSPLYTQAATELGETIASRGYTLVYGGGRTGLMGVVADAALGRGGRVIGVIPEFLKTKELAHAGCTELRTVSSMHERKALMADLSDAFVALPGGIGTLEELVEVWTWAQLGQHHNPCAVLNAGGYYDRLLDFLGHAMSEGFMGARHLEMLIRASSAVEVLGKIEAYEAPGVPKWLDRQKR